MKINKIYILLFTFCIMFFAFSKDSYAFTITDNGNVIELPEISTIIDNNQYLVDYPYYEYVFFGYDGNYFVNLYLSDKPLTDIKFYLNGSNDGLSIINIEDITDTDTFYYVSYAYRSDLNVWKASTVNVNEVGPETYTRIFFKSIFESTVNIYTNKNDNQIFFQAPPKEVALEVEMLEMIAEETPKMAEETIQTMKIILLCGVGCLALLISLPILSKVLRQYLN